MLNPVILYSAGAALLLGLAAGWSARDWKADADQLAAVAKAHKAELAAAKAVAAPSADLEAILADLRPNAIETRNTIREVYRNVEVPTDCAVPAAGVGLLNGARDRANAAATGEPSAVVRSAASGPDAADRP